MNLNQRSGGGAPDATEYESDSGMTTSQYLADKAITQSRTGYAPRDDKELAEKAVDEKLPMGSQSY